MWNARIEKVRRLLEGNGSDTSLLQDRVALDVMVTAEVDNMREAMKDAGKGTSDEILGKSVEFLHRSVSLKKSSATRSSMNSWNSNGS